MKGARLITTEEKNKLARKIKGDMDKFSNKVLGGPCATPGMKIRSKGRGRGLARGRGRGPMGFPW